MCTSFFYAYKKKIPILFGSYKKNAYFCTKLI